MKSALIILSLLSCIFAKYESNLNAEVIQVEAKTIDYPKECTTFPQGTKFYIQYEEKEGVSGKGELKLTLSNVKVNCDFDKKQGTCTTDADVQEAGDLKIDSNSIPIEVKDEDTPVAKVNISDNVNVNAKFNIKYAAPSYKVYQNFTFVNDTEVIKAEDGIQIKFEKNLTDLLKVYLDQERKKALENCRLDNGVIQCPVNKTIFEFETKDNKTERNHTIYVENACGDLYNEKILVGVKWQSSHYVKALGLFSLLLVFIL